MRRASAWLKRARGEGAGEIITMGNDDLLACPPWACVLHASSGAVGYQPVGYRLQRLQARRCGGELDVDLSAAPANGEQHIGTSTDKAATE